ncbi:hypothetical protein KKC59_01865 [bacterium]|nr:hypothetical protein [bacterium]
MRETKLFKLLVCCFCLVFLFGCATGGSGEKRSSRSYDTYEEQGYRSGSRDMSDENDPNYKQIAQNLKFEDIPVPVNYELDLEGSFIFKNDFIRVGICKYLGKGTVTSATNFFKQQMPLFNWELVNSIEYFKSILTFTKEDQSCVVIIEAFKGQVTITIASGPKNRSVME